MRVVLSLVVVAAGAPVVLTPAVAAAGIELPVSGATANKLSDGGEASLARTAVSGDDVYVVWQDRTISPTGVADIAFRHSPDRGAAVSAVAGLSALLLLTGAALMAAGRRRRRTG